MRRFYDAERSEKEKDLITFRESLGESVMPPFATLRHSTLATTGYATQPTTLKNHGQIYKFKEEYKVQITISC